MKNIIPIKTEIPAEVMDKPVICWRFACVFKWSLKLLGLQKIAVIGSGNIKGNDESIAYLMIVFEWLLKIKNRIIVRLSLIDRKEAGWT